MSIESINPSSNTFGHEAQKNVEKPGSPATGGNGCPSPGCTGREKKKEMQLVAQKATCSKKLDRW
jgi:hypothetical protein